MKPAKASTHSVPYSYLSSRWSSSADCQELTSCLAPSRMHFKNMESSSPVSSSVPPNHLVVEFRLKNGLCHSCGARIYHIEEESGRVIPLTIPGVSLEGRCLFCYPDETRCKKRRRVDLETSLPPVIKCEPVEDYSSSHVARLPAHANLSNDHEEILVGEFDAAQPSYEISIQDADQNKYTGVVSEGTAKKGTGLFRFVCKKGEFKGKESIFEGGFENGRMEGKGTIRDASGCVYVGSFHLGAAHGSGVCTWAQGWKYEGDWVMDQREGRGKLQQDAENGEVYEGEWKKDQWHGKGELKFNGGGRYVGDFRNHKLEGQGRYEFADGSVYEGAFKNDQRVGFGTMGYEDGSRYVGEWRHNWREGTGSLFHTDGSEFRGTFRGDEKISGVLHLPDGIMRREHYVNGVLQG